MTVFPSQPSTALLPCPFCKKPAGSKVGPPAMARCVTPGCDGTKLAAYTFAEWNTHAAPPSTETPHTATPWTGSLSVDLRKGALSVSADGLTLIDEKHVCWGIIFPDKTGNYDHAVTFTESVNSHAALTAKVAELVTELRKLAIKQHIRMASGGGHVNNGRSCAVCMGAWEDHAPEFHAVTCPLFDSAGMDNADGGRG